MKLILLAVLCLSCGAALAQSKTTFGSTNASRCYNESNAPFSDYGLRYCTDAIEKDDLLLRDLAATYTNRGIILAANGRYEEAMTDHNEAMLLAPNMAKIYVNRGNVFHQLHQYDDALADYDKAIELGTERSDVALDIVYYNRSLTLIRQKRWDEAKASLEQALEINPDSGRAKRKLLQFNAPVPPEKTPATEEDGGP